VAAFSAQKNELTLQTCKQAKEQGPIATAGISSSFKSSSVYSLNSPHPLTSPPWHSTFPTLFGSNFVPFLPSKNVSLGLFFLFSLSMTWP
jgi:hypothetical protein